MDLSILIVNYKSSALITQCLRSLVKQHWQCTYEVFVIDNHSQDNSEGDILAQFPNVKWIQMGYNAGFARANNAGMRVAKGRLILLLNPDTIILDDSIDRCLDKLQSSSFVAAGVQLLDDKGFPQISGSYFVRGGLNHLLPIPYMGALIKQLATFVKQDAPNVKVAGEVEEVDWISGAFLMVKQCAVEKAGLLDEDFFLYAEEVEWCSRLRKVGKLAIFGNLKIVHLEGGSINQVERLNEKGYYNLYDKKGLQLMVSNHLRVRKQYGRGWFLLLLLFYTLGVPMFFLCSVFDFSTRLKNPFSDIDRIKKYLKNVCELWLLSYKIIKNKPYFYRVL